MKKLFMLFAFIGLFGATTVSAQACSKSKAACTAAAAKAASLESDIEKRMSEETGEISYVRKSVCEVSGKTTYMDVAFDEESKKFVNVSPTHTVGNADKKACCSKGKEAACCAKGKEGCSKKNASTKAVKKTSTAKAVKTSSTN